MANIFFAPTFKIFMATNHMPTEQRDKELPHESLLKRLSAKTHKRTDSLAGTDTQRRMACIGWHIQ